jgi:hypothetical protein
VNAEDGLPDPRDVDTDSCCGTKSVVRQNTPLEEREMSNQDSMNAVWESAGRLAKKLAGQLQEVELPKSERRAAKKPKLTYLSAGPSMADELYGNRASCSTLLCNCPTCRERRMAEMAAEQDQDEVIIIDSPESPDTTDDEEDLDWWTDGSSSEGGSDTYRPVFSPITPDWATCGEETDTGESRGAAAEPGEDEQAVEEPSEISKMLAASNAQRYWA